MRNSIVLAILFCISILIFGLDSRLMILFLFPLTYSFGHSERLAYKMPYIYDIYSCVSHIFYKLSHIFYKTKELKNTTKSETIKM